MLIVKPISKRATLHPARVEVGLQVFAVLSIQAEPKPLKLLALRDGLSLSRCFTETQALLNTSGVKHVHIDCSVQKQLLSIDNIDSSSNYALHMPALGPP